MGIPPRSPARRRPAPPALPTRARAVLPLAPKPPLAVALAFREQLVRGGVPMAAHDRRVDALATPDALLLCSGAARDAEAGRRGGG
jgi:hypothetical protein